jgi:hypothetical protein
MGINDFVEMKNPEIVQAHAVRISADGETLQSGAEAVVNAIGSIEAETPWGSDKYGAQFVHSYESSDGGEQANESVKKSATTVGDEATKIGDATTQAVLDYSATDDTNASGINSVRPA